ncbi:MAG: metallophosphoesterase [Candidatus Dojkabacteria bacterium]|nr:metallophosphoesterase [Candidatus Dojkabacteria bacterium]
MQPKLLKKIFKKKPSFKLLFIISIILVLLISTTFIFINSKSLNITISNSKLLNLIQKEDTEEETTSEENTRTKNNSSDDQVDIPETSEEDDTTTSNNTVEDDNNEEETQDEDEDNNSSSQEPEDLPEPEPTVPESPSAYIAFYSDNQSDSDADDVNHQRVVNYILNSGANPIFHAGDIMEDGTQDSLDIFNAVTQTLRSTRTFYAALGNNDRVVGDSTTPSPLFLNNFSFPNNERWYSVNYGNLHMIILDSAFASTSTTQTNWLINDLQSSASQDRITGVMFHHPTFSSNIASYLVDYGADFIISGHLHSYSHYMTSGIDQFVLSGQPNIGYMIGRVYSDEIKITVYNSNNSVIDSVTIEDR